jgi:lycopene cyclase domain-containing protein
VWDVLFTIHGIWSFNPGFVLGFYLFHLPLEEYLFFLFIPYACVFTYYCIGLFFNLSAYSIPVSKLTVVFIFILLVIAATHLPELYTSVTFILLQLFLSFLVLKKVKWLPLFYFSFFTILFPFFISNGILTGSIIREPVVLYNNNYNLGIRIFTIPIEDTFYGMLLMLMNVAGFEYLKGKGNLKK